MKEIIKLGTLVLAGSVAAGSAMAAAKHQAVGKIEHLNPRGHTLTVNHEVYRYNPRLASGPLKRGEWVHITYRVGHGHRIVEKIKPVSA